MRFIKKTQFVLYIPIMVVLIIGFAGSDSPAEQVGELFFSADYYNEALKDRKIERPTVYNLVENNTRMQIIRNTIIEYNFEGTCEDRASYKAYLIYREATRNDIDPFLLTAVGIEESNLRANPPDSSAGAKGMFQLMPVIYDNKYNINPYDLEDNTKVAADFLAHLRDMYFDKSNIEYSLKLMLVHYNAGSNPDRVLYNNPRPTNYAYNIISYLRDMRQEYQRKD